MYFRITEEQKPTRCHLLFYCNWLQPGHYSSLISPNLQPTANQERNDQCGNQQHSHELLTMVTVMPETY